MDTVRAGNQCNALYIGCLYKGSKNIFWWMKEKSPELILLGKAIRSFREQAGFSQDSFALEVGLGRSYYGSLERGEINASYLTLLKISTCLQVKLADLLPESCK